MSLLKKLLINEEASKGSIGSDKIARKHIRETASGGSTAGGSIANVRGSLFTGGVVDHAKAKKKRIAKADRVGKIQYEGKVKRMHFLKGLLEANEGKIRQSDREKFDPKDVISKFDAAEKKTKLGSDTATFGLEDEEGNVVKVHIAKDQAEDFETALAQLLSGADEDDDDENSAVEIAEVLFKLRDKFTIIDIEWPKIPEDVEEEQEADAGALGADPAGARDKAGGIGGLEAGAEGEGSEVGAEGGGDELSDLEGGKEGDMDMTADTSDDDVQGAATALTQVIDMMKADAEAKTAEAEARKAEAKAREAEALAKTAEHKVSAEEQILDMETHEKKKKNETDEAKQLAKLAKYRHETKGVTTQDDFKDVDSEEDEEQTTINIKDFASLLQQHMGR